MIEDKNSLIEKLEKELNAAKKIVADNSELFEECKPYHDSWVAGAEGRIACLCISNNFIGVNLTITTAETDSMKDVNLFIDKIPYELIRVIEYTYGKWIQLNFASKSGNLTVFCKYGRSRHCKLVETGEVLPIYERVCI